MNPLSYVGLKRQNILVARKMTQVEVEALFLKHSMKVLGKYVNSMTPLKSECLLCGHTITPRLDKVKLRGHQCGYCAGRLGVDLKALETLKKLGHKPLIPYPGALVPWKMKCGGCGKTISPKYNSIQQGNFGCGYCGHSRSGEKRRHLSSKEAERILAGAFCEPLEPYPGTHVPWKSRCMKCDSLVRPRLSGIKAGQGGCRKCGLESGAKARMLTEKEALARLRKLKLKALEIYPGTAKPWKCECLRCGSIVRPRLNYLARSIYGCAVCAGSVVDTKAARDLMKKAKLIPQVKFPGSDNPWLSICQKCKREVSPRYSSIKAGQGGCIWCVGKKVDPLIAIQAMKSKGLQPLEPFVSASARWNCQCLRCSRSITTTYKLASTSAGGCKYCAPNFVNLARIKEVMSKAGLVPQEKYPGSKSPWKVQHTKCGRVFVVEYANIRKASSCRYCAGVAVIPAEAVKVMEALGIKPLTPYPGAKKPWKCKCIVCKRTIYPIYSSSASRNSGCIYCTGHKVDSKDAKKLMITAGLIPLEPFPGAAKKWKCRCQTCKRVVTPRYTSVQGRQGGCRFCADWGIDYGAPGFLYLMTHEELSSHKIGIGNSERSRGRSRITQHEKHNWKLYRQLDFDVTDDAFQIEQKVLSWLRDVKGLGVFLSEFEMPQGGYSETVDASEIDLPTIWAIVEEFSKVKK